MPTEHQPEQPPQQPAPEPSPLEPAMRAGKLFIWPFMFSMAMAFVGARRDVDWMYYAGLGGVGLSMCCLFVWLTRA